MKNLYLFGFAVLFLAGGAGAAGQECAIDTDCGEGEMCAPAPCLPVECDPDDETCEAPDCPSSCVDLGDAGGDGSWNDCETDADCGAGLECKVNGSVATACACPDNAEECDCAPDAEPVEFKQCVPKQCKADADCPTGLECVTMTDDCATATDAFCEGECPEPAPCEAETWSWCQPKWAGACEVDADCGEGFTCKAYEECSCDGGAANGGGAGPSDPGGEEGDGSAEEPSGDAIPVDPSCECGPSETKSCEPIEQVCTTDADCPAEWKCEAFGAQNGGVSPDCGPNETCDNETDPATPPEPSGPPSPAQKRAAPPAEEQKLCVPPYFTEFAEAGALPSSGPMADGETFPAVPKGGDQNTDAPVDDTAGDGADAADAADGAGSSDSEESTDGAAGSEKAAAAGCAVNSSTEASATGFLALLVLGLAAFVARRRTV